MEHSSRFRMIAQRREKVKNGVRAAAAVSVGGKNSLPKKYWISKQQNEFIAN